MDVSENSGTPQSSIWIGFSIINHPFWGTPIFGNTHIYTWHNLVPLLKVLLFRFFSRLTPSCSSRKATSKISIRFAVHIFLIPIQVFINVHNVWANHWVHQIWFCKNSAYHYQIALLPSSKVPFLRFMCTLEKVSFKSNIETTLLKTNIAPKNGGFQ